MSGPKVVRVVSRQELQARALAQLGQLDRALRACHEAGLEMADNRFDAETRERRGELQRLFESDRFSELAAQVAAELTFIESRTRQRHEQAVRARAERKAFDLSARKTAAAMLARVSKEQIALDRSLLEALKAAEKGSLEGDAVERALAQATIAMAPVDKQATLSAEQKAHAAKLMRDGADAPQSWSGAKALEALGPQAAATFRQVAELELLSGQEAAKAYAHRLEEALAMESGATRSLHLNSLQLDLSAALDQSRKRTQTLREVEALLDQLQAARAEPALLYRLRQLISGSSGITDLASALAEGKTALEKLEAEQFAEARRAAVLEGLAELGYSANEGMGTAWQQAGSLVVDMPSHDNVGVEFVGASTANRLQVRAVSYNQDRDRTRDREVEEQWCGDFSKLQSRLAQKGHALEIERALPVGAAELKVVTGRPPDARRRSSTNRSA